MLEQKLKEQYGYNVPEAPTPLAAYIPAVQDGKLIFTSGQLPIQEGKLQFTGKLGKDISDVDAKKAAEICIVNCLSVVKTFAGSLENIDKILKITVFVASGEGFTAQPAIANGASELLVNVFGEVGKHARSAVGVAELPLGAPVEIEMIARLK